MALSNIRELNQFLDVWWTLDRTSFMSYYDDCEGFGQVMVDALKMWDYPLYMKILNITKGN